MEQQPQHLAQLQQLRNDFHQARQALFTRLQETGKSVLKPLTHRIDQLLQDVWRVHGLDQHDAALVAVGGYGRAEQFPHSDVDVLVLLATEPAPDSALHHCITEFVSSCWDLGLQIGSSVRTVEQCLTESANDITVQTALLERRLLVGNPALFQALSAAYDSAMQPYAFFLGKTLEMRQRYAKFQNTPYALEPNCKESPGGLRDLHTILWVAKAAGYGHTWDGLVRSGLLTPYEANQCRRSHALLSAIRSRLHLVANRREDRLVFDLQTQVAEAFGYTYQARAKGIGQRPSELLMRRYYWTAKAVVQLCQIVLLNIAERLRDEGHTREHDPAPVTKAMLALQTQPIQSAPQPTMAATPQLDVAEYSNPVASTATGRPDFLAPETHNPLLPINAHFLDKNGWLEVVDDQLYHRQPQAILETFVVLQRNKLKGLSARTLRALYNARVVMDRAFRADPVNREQFMHILQAPSGVTHALRLMNQTSVLGRYLWVFRKIVGQMQHDLFHIYTVDQHILMVVRNVRRFFIPEHAHEFPFCSQLAAEWPDPWILSTAALFHDIAKGRGGDHSQLGEIEMRRFAARHGISAADTDLLAFLVREHLTMSSVAQKQDVSDPEVIRAFAERVGSARYLTALYLLTVADIRGTSPKVWNGWKGKLLEDLYKVTLRTLGGETQDRASLAARHKQEALVELARYAMPHAGHVKLWNTLDAAYFMRHEAGDIAWQTRHVARWAGQGKTIVRARLSPHGEGLQVVVYTPDQPALFARICSYFDRNAFNILDAKVHTTTDGYALDSFLVVTSALPEHYREFLTMVENSLTRALEQPSELPSPAQGRVSRRARSFPITPIVTLTPDEQNRHWILTINATDRQGLLYCIARVLAQFEVQIHLAKIATTGERVEDSFLLQGQALSSDKVRAQIEGELMEVLG